MSQADRDGSQGASEQSRRGGRSIGSPNRGRRWLLIAAAGVAAIGSLAFRDISSSGASPATPSHLPVAQLVSLAQGMVRSLGDPGVKAAWVVASTKSAAENATYPGSEPADPANPRAYLIMVHGRFVCRVTCSYPAGAKPPTGRFAYEIWIPGHGVSDFGITPREPSSVNNLGPIIRLRLATRPRPARRPVTSSRSTTASAGATRAWHQWHGERGRLRVLPRGIWLGCGARRIWPAPPIGGARNGPETPTPGINVPFGARALPEDCVASIGVR